MADYIYLLENRLSAAQREALRLVRELARKHNLTVFLVGGAVRDLTTGSPVRDLDVVVQGNALKLKQELEAAGATVIGEHLPSQALFLSFPGSVRLELGSTLSVTYPKPGKPVFKPSGIQDDLRRRDFTANAMALSLNMGSYGLLMDPLNGIADIENREVRLVSNYGFIEEPVRLVRATRLMARLGWAMDDKTQQRYENAKSEDLLATISPWHGGYELEEIFHEEDPIRILGRLEIEGWLKQLAPFWSSSKINVSDLEHLRETQTKLQMQGIHPDPSAAHFPLLTAKLPPSDVAQLKASFPRPGFVREIESLESRAKDLAAQLTAKAAALPSQTWRIITSASPDVVLWLMFSTRSAALQAKFSSFTSTWPQARQKIPHAILQEMRIVPELAGYDELIEKLQFELMDDKLQTTEELKAFLEPYSPPAPPPPVNMRRARASKKEAKVPKSRAKKVVVAVSEDDDEEAAEKLSQELEEALDEALDLADADDAGSESRQGTIGRDSEDSDAADDHETAVEAVDQAQASVEPAPARSAVGKAARTTIKAQKVAAPAKSLSTAQKPVIENTKSPVTVKKSVIEPKKAPVPLKKPSLELKKPLVQVKKPSLELKKPAVEIGKASVEAKKPSPGKKAAAKGTGATKAPPKSVTRPAPRVPAKPVARPLPQLTGKQPAKALSRTATPTAKKSLVKVVAKKAAPMSKAVSAKKTATLSPASNKVVPGRKR